MSTAGATATVTDKRGRTSPNQSGRVHLIPGPQVGYVPGRQPARCGVIPTADLRRWGTARWFWTEETANCLRCRAWAHENTTEEGAGE
jgi:hypothetical protein